jgi:hypothetical protein
MALLTAVIMGASWVWVQPQSAYAAEGSPNALSGKVQVAGGPIAGSTVTLYAAGDSEPLQLAQVKTGDDGTFNLDVGQVAAGKVLYVVARGGTPKATTGKRPDDALALLAVLGTTLPKAVTVNELTTVASAFTAARFINGEAISGNLLGLRIAAGNVPNLVDPETGEWGKVLIESVQQHLHYDVGELQYPRVSYQRLLHCGGRRLARPLPQGRNATRRNNIEDHLRGHGGHCPRPVGQPIGALRTV